VVAFVAGSGPAARDGYGTLPPISEQFASKGIGTLAWDKPGVGESSGNWRLQTTGDRAQEVLDAIAFLRSQPEVNPAKVGLWGISQAGWVIPIVTARGGNPAFLIAVSHPVSTGLEQEIYRLREGLPKDGFSKSEVSEAIEFVKARSELMKKPASFPEYLALQDAAKGKRWLEQVGAMGEQDYGFLQTRTDLSPMGDLPTIKCPVLAIFGDRDTIVDWRQSSRTYRSVLRKAGNRDVTIKIFKNADHVLFPSKTGSMNELNSSFGRTPKVFAPGYLELMSGWIQQRTTP
jgi:pimeloyl-ACP methyl ester carboxylesterase